MHGGQRPDAILFQLKDSMNYLKSWNSIQPKNKVSVFCIFFFSNQLQLNAKFILKPFFSVNEMLQTAKLFARRSNNGIDVRGSTLASRQMNGLTFGEFCVLAADLKRFRTQSQYPVPLSRKDGFNVFSNQNALTATSTPSSSPSTATATTPSTSNHHYKDGLKPVDRNAAPEVFLGGSCNPTTWRADVAIPTLDKLGISFYNPVSKK